MPSWQGKSKGTAIGYRLFFWAIKSFGIFPAYFILLFVALYYFLFSIKTSKAIYYYFHKRLGYNMVSSILKIYLNYYFFGQSLIDKVVIMAGISNKFTFDFDGEENLRKMTRMGKGGILLSAHIGNWEAAGHLLKRLDTKINVVMYDGEHQQIKEYLESVTGKRNLNVILIRDSVSHIYEISEALNKNELVCMHADRFLEGNKTMNQSFLNEEAPFPVGPFLLAAQFKVPVSYVFAMKESSTHYHFSATSIRENKSDDKKTAVKILLSEFVIEMEKKIKAYPLQWYNYYNFWNTESWQA